MNALFSSPCTPTIKDFFLKYSNNLALVILLPNLTGQPFYCSSKRESALIIISYSLNSSPRSIKANFLNV